MVAFSIYLAFSICFISNLEIGMSQTIAFPRDSHLLDYFGNISKYLKTGAPLYFVVNEGLDYSKPARWDVISTIVNIYVDLDGILS